MTMVIVSCLIPIMSEFVSDFFGSICWFVFDLLTLITSHLIPYFLLLELNDGQLVLSKNFLLGFNSSYTYD